MTRDQIVTLITGTVGQTDSTSVSLCNDYVQHALQSVWNADLWKDSKTTDTSASVSSGVNNFSLPSGLDRIVSIQIARSGNVLGFLDPTTSEFIIQTEPTSFINQGVPTKYEEYTSSGTKKVRVFPVPNDTYTFTIVGKATCPTLSGSTSLPIRNADDVVMAYATAKMYERMRQLGKAAAKAQEASALLEQLRQIEKGQSNQPRAAKSLTVSGNSLAELTDAVCTRCAAWQPEMLILAKEFIRRNYKRIYDMCLWPDSLVVARVDSDGEQLVLPHYFGRVISVRYGAKLPSVDIVDLSLLWQMTPAIFEDTATQPLAYSKIASIGLAALPPVQEKLTFVSSSPADKGNIFVRGESSGQEYEESVPLSGTTIVHTARAYDTPLTVSKLTTVGTITITGLTSGATLQTLLPNEKERKHIRLWFQPANGTTETSCLVLGKRRINALVQDEDTTLLSNMSDVLINYSASDLLLRLSLDGNKDASDLAQSYRAQADAALKSLVEQTTEQEAHSSRVVPEIEPYSNSYCDEWLVAKF